MTSKEENIGLGRACVRLIETIEVLVETERRQKDHAALLRIHGRAIERLRQIVGDGDPAITAQIMAVSDTRLGTVKDVMLN